MKARVYVTATGIGREPEAAEISGMHGPFRIPTMLKYADQLCRHAAREQPHLPQTVRERIVAKPWLILA